MAHLGRQSTARRVGIPPGRQVCSKALLSQAGRSTDRQAGIQPENQMYEYRQAILSENIYFL
jgi:hypothetical protein